MITTSVARQNGLNYQERCGSRNYGTQKKNAVNRSLKRYNLICVILQANQWALLIFSHVKLLMVLGVLNLIGVFTG